MYGGAESWSSKKQPTAAASTMDAEYQACGVAAREGLSLIRAIGEMGIPVVIVCAQATCMHLTNWSDYMSYCYKKGDEYRLSWTHVSLLFDLLPML
jgi:hypothetical protein